MRESVAPCVVDGAPVGGSAADAALLCELPSFLVELVDVVDAVVQSLESEESERMIVVGFGRKRCGSS